MSADRRGQLIDAIEADIGDPRAGLPENVFEFVSRLTPLVNVDLLIQEDGRTLLSWRDDELAGTGWHLPGGVIRYKETAAQRIRACARDELGAEVVPEDAPLMILEAITTQRTRAHHISLLFRCRLHGGVDERRRAAADPPGRGQWRWHRGAPPDLLPGQRPYARFL